MTFWRRIKQTQIDTKLWNQFTRSYLQIHNPISANNRIKISVIYNRSVASQTAQFEIPSNFRFFAAPVQVSSTCLIIWFICITKYKIFMLLISLIYLLFYFFFFGWGGGCNCSLRKKRKRRTRTGPDWMSKSLRMLFASSLMKVRTTTRISYSDCMELDGNKFMLYYQILTCPALINLVWNFVPVRMVKGGDVVYSFLFTQRNCISAFSYTYLSHG